MIRAVTSGLVLFVLVAGCAGNTSRGEPTESGPPTSDATATKQPRETSSASATTPVDDGSTGGDTGTLRGQVCYPSEYIPAMTAFFQDVASGDVLTLAIAENQTSYEMTLPPATYLVFAYRVDVPTLGGAYTEAVPCGLDATCTDHTPRPVVVEAGGALEGIDLCDWYALDDVPPNPRG